MNEKNPQEHTKHDPLSLKSLPEEILDKISGGVVEKTYSLCPYCNERLFKQTEDDWWMIYCDACGNVIDASFLDWD